MKKEIGLWIDHHRTYLVTVVDENLATMEIRSNIGKDVRISRPSRAKAVKVATEAPADDSKERQHGDHLGRYYDGVVSFLRDADSILLFGPGEAKGELKKRLVDEGLGERVVGMKSVDKMTDRQITEKVRSFFA
jgi:hypothetical protein